MNMLQDNKKPAALIAVFIAGILFAGLSYLVIRNSGPFLQKVYGKIKERRIANIPKAKEALVLCDFDEEAEISKWQVNNAGISLSAEHPTSGKNSAKIIYRPAKGAASAALVKLPKDWSGYEVFSFDLFNPSAKKERLILQIKDSRQRRVKLNLSLLPNEITRVEVDVRSLWDKLKPADIESVNLFLWDNSKEKVFYADNFRLLPEAAFEKAGKNILDAQFQVKPGEQIYAAADYSEFDKARWIKADKGAAPVVETPLLIGNFPFAQPPGIYLEGGIPFGRGQISSFDNLAIYAQGKQVPYQAKALCRWPDKSIKWALFTLLGAGQQFALSYPAEKERHAPGPALKITDAKDKIAVETGKLSFSVSKKSFRLFEGLRLGNKPVCGGTELSLTHNNRQYRASLDRDCKVVIEESGPLKACIRAEGWFVSERQEKFCKFVARIYAFAGADYLKVQHTLIYTGYPENKYHYLYKGKRLPKNETIQEISLKTELPAMNNADFTFSADGKIMQSALKDRVEFFQLKHDAYSLMQGKNTLNSGKQLGGWLDLSSAGGGLSIGIKNFWQQYPKAFRASFDAGAIEAVLWPKEAGELDLRTTRNADGPDAVARGSAFGLAKTHELYFYFHNGAYADSAAKEIMSGLAADILLAASPEWASDTRALGRVRQAQEYERRGNSAEEFLSRLFDWGARQITDFHWYGFIDFGDTLSWYRKENYPQWGWNPDGRWGWFNCEAVGTHTGALIQFLRTGDAKYLIFGLNLSRHIMDIDTCHYNTVKNDRRLKGRIPDDYSQPGSMHRHNANHWGGRNEEASHTNITGIMLYYYLTGDPRAYDVMQEVGAFFLDERITYFRHPDIAPQRSIANVLWGDVLLYELTGEQKYKTAADKLANLFYLGQKYDGAWPENYNPARNRWEGKPHLGFIREYTLPALIAYHQITGNKAIAECIIKGTDYVMRAEEYGAYFNAAAYSYWLTADNRYRGNIDERLGYTLRHQKQSDDPLWEGMVYQKGYYARVMEYLYSMPFAFEALIDEK